MHNAQCQTVGLHLPTVYICKVLAWQRRADMPCRQNGCFDNSAYAQQHSLEAAFGLDWMSKICHQTCKNSLYKLALAKLAVCSMSQVI